MTINNTINFGLCTLQLTKLTKLITH